MSNGISSRTGVFRRSSGVEKNTLERDSKHTQLPKHEPDSSDVVSSSTPQVVVTKESLHIDYVKPAEVTEKQPLLSKELSSEILSLSDNLKGYTQNFLTVKHSKERDGAYNIAQNGMNKALATIVKVNDLEGDAKEAAIKRLLVSPKALTRLSKAILGMQHGYEKMSHMEASGSRECQQLMASILDYAAKKSQTEKGLTPKERQKISDSAKNLKAYRNVIKSGLDSYGKNFEHPMNDIDRSLDVIKSTEPKGAILKFFGF